MKNSESLPKNTAGWRP